MVLVISWLKNSSLLPTGSFNFNKLLNNNENTVDHLIDKMVILNPLNLMKKGYSISYQNNKVISSVKDLNLKHELKIKM